MPAREDALLTLLHTTFGFSEFRAGQERVCQAVVDGRDVLVVMPTGAGKSLCYQLPAVARGGTALVISPLISLMEDQTAKLGSLGLRVARIHSGLPADGSFAASPIYRWRPTQSARYLFRKIVIHLRLCAGRRQ